MIWSQLMALIRKFYTYREKKKTIFLFTCNGSVPSCPLLLLLVFFCVTWYWALTRKLITWLCFFSVTCSVSSFGLGSTWKATPERIKTSMKSKQYTHYDKETHCTWIKAVNLNPHINTRSRDWLLSSYVTCTLQKQDDRISKSKETEHITQTQKQINLMSSCVTCYLCFVQLHMFLPSKKIQ